MAKRLQRTLRVDQILYTEGNSIALLAEKARRLKTIEQQICRTLGSPLADHVVLGECTPRRLVLVTDSPVWSSRLRYQSRRIVQSIAEYFTSQTPPRVEIKVSPVQGRRTRKVARRAGISKVTARHLDRAVDAFPDNEALQAVLRRLASRAKPQPD